MVLIFPNYAVRVLVLGTEHPSKNSRAEDNSRINNKILISGPSLKIFTSCPVSRYSVRFRDSLLYIFTRSRPIFLPNIYLFDLVILFIHMVRKNVGDEKKQKAEDDKC